MAWTIDYTAEARSQLKKLDRQVARRIVDFMDTRIAPQNDPRTSGKALTGPLGDYWRYRVGDSRIICNIQNNVLRILVVELGNRKDVYRR